VDVTLGANVEPPPKLISKAINKIPRELFVHHAIYLKKKKKKKKKKN
jgi:hypothetical protein